MCKQGAEVHIYLGSRFYTQKSDHSLIFGLIGGLVVGLIFGLIGGLKTDIQTRTRPNQGIWNSLKNMVILCTIALVTTPMLYLLLTHLLPMILEQTITNLIISIVLPLPIFCAFLAGGGRACIQHFSMRLVLHLFHQIPWNFVTFFKQAEARLFIQRSGGSYSFIHRYLQEHFASLDL